MRVPEHVVADAEEQCSRDMDQKMKLSCHHVSTSVCHPQPRTPWSCLCHPTYTVSTHWQCTWFCCCLLVAEDAVSAWLGHCYRHEQSLKLMMLLINDHDDFAFATDYPSLPADFRLADLSTTHMIITTTGYYITMYWLDTSCSHFNCYYYFRLLLNVSINCCQRKLCKKSQ